MSFRSKTRFSRLVLAATVGAAMVIAFAGTGARAQDDDEEPALDTKILQGVLKAFGLRNGSEKSIDYRERSPLVLPPGKDLPPPEAGAQASKTAGWPDDPDVKRVKLRKKAERDRQPYTEGVDDRPLMPSQYGTNAPPRRPSGGSATGPFPDTDETSRPSSPAALGSKSWFSSLFASKEEYTTFTGEPPRGELIEPPAGYRTPSPNQPYGVGKEKWKPPVIDRQAPVQ